MAKIKLNGDTSGYIEISAPAVSGNNTLELGPGTRILTNLDNTFTGITTFSNGIHITSGGFILNQQRSDTHASLIIDKPDTGTGTLKFFNNGSASAYIQHTNAEHLNYYLPSGSGYHSFYTNGTEKLRITSGGQLNFAGNMQFTAATPELEFNSGGPRFRVPAANTLTIHTGGGLGTTSNERLRIDSSGRLKVGTTNDIIWNQTSEVGAVIEQSGATQIVRNGDVPLLVTRNTSTGQIAKFSQAGTERGSILYDGDFGIASAGNLTFDISGTERLRIDSSGHLLHGVTADEDTSGNGGLRFINSGDIQIDGDQKALVFRSTNNTAQLQSAIEWWNENGAGVQSKIACDRTAVSQAPSDLVFYTSSNVDLGGAGNDGAITERLRITSGGHLVIGSGYADFQSGTRGETGSTDPYKLVFQNQYSTGYTDGQLKLYLFNSGNTRQGFGPGPSYDLQYHCSGGAADQSRHSFYTDNVLRMQIHDATGIVKPTQPGFYARRTTSGDGRAAGSITEWHISGTGSYNEGGHFKTSGADQGKFVAPVTGKYYFSAQPGYKQTNENFQFYFRINGNAINEPVRFIDGGDDLTSHSACTGSCIVHMTTGQKLDVYVGNTHHVNTTFNFFCGYLIG